MWPQVMAPLLLLIPLVLVVAEDEPFSIGLGTLSPSYAQTVGKDEKNIIKVNFQQRDDGVSYTITDPQSGTNSYYNFGGSANALGPAPADVKDLEADQFTQNLRAPQPQEAYPQPQVIIPQPQVIIPQPQAHEPQPIYQQEAAYLQQQQQPFAHIPQHVQHVDPVVYNNPRVVGQQDGYPVVVQYNSMHSASPAAVPYNSQPVPAAVPYSPQPVPYNPQPVPYNPQPVPYNPQPVPYIPLPVRAAIPIAPALFQHHAMDGQRFAKNAESSNLIPFQAPFQAPAPPPFIPYQAGPAPGFIQQPFFPPQAGFFPRGFQASVGGFMGQGPRGFAQMIPPGYAQMLPPGVAQFGIQSRSHGGHTEEDLAARQKSQ